MGDTTDTDKGNGSQLVVVNALDVDSPVALSGHGGCDADIIPSDAAIGSPINQGSIMGMLVLRYAVSQSGVDLPSICSAIDGNITGCGGRRGCGLCRREHPTDVSRGYGGLGTSRIDEDVGWL